MQAGRLLIDMGYTRISYYPGGLQDWQAHGRALEATPLGARASSTRSTPHAPARRTPGDVVLDSLGRMTPGVLFQGWLGVVAAFGVLYWVLARVGMSGLRHGEDVVAANWQGLADSLYFSFVTALSIGYGDVTPVGAVRALAILEGTTGLVLFGVFISKLVSRRQEEMTVEIHRNAFEDRLGRVRMNLHMVLGELQALTAASRDQGFVRARNVPATESAAAVFAGELRSVHDLLYRPQQTPEEDVLETILASVSAVLAELSESLAHHPPSERSETMNASLRAVRRLALEICGDCVPRAYVKSLKDWMDRIQTLAATLD